MRRTFFSLFGLSLVVGTTGMATADAPPAAADSTVVQTVAQPRLFGPRTSGRPTVRRYRSYSIDPGVAGVPVPASPGVVDAAPSFARPAPSAPRSSKPSYLRGDAKARGQFGR